MCFFPHFTYFCFCGCYSFVTVKCEQNTVSVCTFGLTKRYELKEKKKHTQPNEWKEITRCAFHYMRYFVVWLCFENKIIHVIRFWIFFLCRWCCCCLFSLHFSMEHCNLLLSFFVARFLILNIVVIWETSFPVYFFNFPFFVAEDFIDSQR